MQLRVKLIDNAPFSTYYRNQVETHDCVELQPFSELMILALRGGNIMATLRKSDLSGRVAAKLGGSKAQGETALKAVLDTIAEALGSGDRVVLTGFGSFEVRDVKARKVRPIRGAQEGQLIEVPAHKRVGFTAGAELTKSAQG